MGKYRTPNYWWDFKWDGDKMTHIAVESDYDELPFEIKNFPP